MAFTVQNVLDRAIQVANGFPPASDPQALQYINEAQNEIAIACGLYPWVKTDIVLVAEQQEYLLDPDIDYVSTATYFSNVESWFTMRQTSIDDLDQRYYGWASDQSGTPFKFYINGDYIGFYQKPNQATDLSGYPKVTLSVRRANQFTTYADTLPTQTRSLAAWAYGAALKYALDRADDRAGLLNAAFQDELAKLKSSTARRSIRYHPSVKPRHQTPRNR